MSKRMDYEIFAGRMRNVTNRPVFLHGMFERGLTVIEATAEMAQLKARGEHMFKFSTHGRAERVIRKDRVMTLELMQRTALRGAYAALRSVYHRRATPGAREWRETQLQAIEAQLSHGD